MVLIQEVPVENAEIPAAHVQFVATLNSKEDLDQIVLELTNYSESIHFDMNQMLIKKILKKNLCINLTNF